MTCFKAASPSFHEPGMKDQIVVAVDEDELSVEVPAFLRAKSALGPAKGSSQDHTARFCVPCGCQSNALIGPRDWHLA